MAAMVATTVTFGMPLRTPVAHAQTAPVGAGFPLDAGDLRFIYHAIEIAQQHAVTRTAQNPCGTLIGNGPNQVADPQLPLGLRLVDGSCNNLVTSPDQHLFGASDMPFPRLTTKVFRGAQPFDADGPGGQPAVATSYNQTSGFVSDPQPRTASNLVVEQKRAANPAANAIAGPDTSGDDPVTGTVFIPNVTPDFGLSAPFNLMFAFFGQFFDHGLDLVNKGGNGTVLMPLAADDPLFSTAPGAPNFIPLTRATVDPAHEAVNQTTPWVDQLI
jgi:hypothetical protein